MKVNCSGQPPGKGNASGGGVVNRPWLAQLYAHPGGGVAVGGPPPTKKKCEKREKIVEIAKKKCGTIAALGKGNCRRNLKFSVYLTMDGEKGTKN